MRKVSSQAKKYDDVPVAYLTISITIDELAKHWNGYSEEFKKRQCESISTKKYADDFKAYMDAYAKEI